MSKTFETVSIHDPAIDLEATTPRALREFAETRDMKKIVFRKDVKPCRYTLKEISHSMMNGWVMAVEADQAQATRAFQCGVMSVTNYPQEDGSRVESWSPPRDKADAIEDKWLERFPLVVLAEIGGVALRRSFFGPTITHGYVLPPLSAALLVEQIGRHADASRNTPAPSSEPASSASEGVQ